MTRRRSRLRHYEPSLVPLADMLTNTVGVVLFILIFTVLTAGGAVLTKRLPMERPTKAKPMAYLCAFGRIGPLELRPVAEEFMQALPKNVSLFNLDDFVAKFKSRKVETPYFTARGVEEGALFLAFGPKASSGETADELAQPGSKFRRALANSQPDQRYVRFVVYPDSITTFRAARDIAAVNNFGADWTLFGTGEEIKICVLGCGSRGGDDQDVVK